MKFTARISKTFFTSTYERQPGFRGFSKKKLLKQTALFALITMPLFFVSTGVQNCRAQNKQAKTLSIEQKKMEKQAAKAKWWLDYSVKNYGFVCSRVSLNVWKSTAMDAGTFDQEYYNKIYKKIYMDSTENNQRCVEAYSQIGDFKTAQTCLEMWKIHSEEIDVFDEEKYELLKAMVK